MHYHVREYLILKKYKLEYLGIKSIRQKNYVHTQTERDQMLNGICHKQWIWVTGYLEFFFPPEVWNYIKIKSYQKYKTIKTLIGEKNWGRVSIIFVTNASFVKIQIWKQGKHKGLITALWMSILCFNHLYSACSRPGAPTCRSANRYETEVWGRSTGNCSACKLLDRTALCWKWKSDRLNLQAYSYFTTN